MKPDPRNSQAALNKALLEAVKQSDRENVVRLLKNNADVNALDDDGKMALVLAAIHAHVDVVKALLRADSIDVNATDKQYGAPALNWAAEKGRVEVVNALLREHHIKVNATEPNGNTALMGSARYGHLEVVNALLKKGANTNLADQNGNTALIWAEGNGHVDVVNALRKHLAYLHKSHAAKIIYPTVTLASIGAIVTAAVLLTPGWPMALAICAAVIALMASEYSHNDRYDRSYVLTTVGIH